MDGSLYDIECIVLALLLGAFILAYTVRRLARTRPGFDVGFPLAVGATLRLAAILLLSLTGVGATLRASDEIGFLANAHQIAASSFDSPLWFPAQFHRLHEILFGLQIKFADFPDGALRVTQVTIALLGMLLIVAAVYDLGGPRASRLAMWMFALEPGSIFFNGVLHREPLLVLTSGLVVLGGTKIWAKLELRGTLMYALGCVIAVSTRPYAGWFLITAGVMLILHASLRQVGSKLRAVPLIYGVAITLAVAGPVVLTMTSSSNLERTLQVSQNSSTRGALQSGQAGTNNLRLESVDFSSRTGLITNLPRRVRDILLRPYPWQIQNTSQQLGAVGTLVAVTALFLLFRYGRRNRGQVLAVCAPFIYPAFFLMLAYALSVANAGTGFRYRTHLVLLALAALAVLREHALRNEAAARDEAAQGEEQRAPIVAGSSVQPSPLLTSRP